MDDGGIDMMQRKQLRLKDYDYSQAGYYFVTICTLHRHETLGRVVGGDAHIAPYEKGHSPKIPSLSQQKNHAA